MSGNQAVSTKAANNRVPDLMGGTNESISVILRNLKVLKTILRLLKEEKSLMNSLWRAFHQQLFERHAHHAQGANSSFLGNIRGTP